MVCIATPEFYEMLFLGGLCTWLKFNCLVFIVSEFISHINLMTDVR